MKRFLSSIALALVLTVPTFADGIIIIMQPPPPPPPPPTENSQSATTTETDPSLADVLWILLLQATDWR